MAAIAWYGPLIDLSKAASHIGDYVQLLVFVHRSRPIQKFKSYQEGALLRTDIQVSDDTRSFFSVSLWQKQMGSMVVAGDVILLQNVKIVKFGDVVEGGTVQFSSLLRLVHPYESLISKGVDELLADCRVGKTTKAKLRKVIEWVQRAGSTLHNVQLHTYQKRQLIRNWKDYEQRQSRDCISIAEVSCINSSCKATFHACVGEIFLPFTWRTSGKPEKERMFISRRLFMKGDNRVAEDLICTGCKLCGSPMDLENGSLLEQNKLYVWDQSEYIPLLVTNNAAELLFGNIRAERVYLCYRRQKPDQNLDLKDDHKWDHCDPRATTPSKAAGEGGAAASTDNSLEPRSTKQGDKNLNFYIIWIILLKTLLQQGKNSPLKFEITVNAGLDQDNGRFEMDSVTMPCFQTNGSSD
ncbi:hypothetical protein HHK36_009030 [Tetracentron sinense]|uniref:Uncharacterized protein n=1 Tax=Tetracentron sinense TaxID=13715 RepID=A0A834ZCC6_TETSI|nr:hypothetical protein HHK36_009030 [Tetracentron sinense]